MRQAAVMKIENKIKFAKILSRKQWLNSHDLPSHVVFTALKSHQAKQNITQLSTHQGITFNPYTITQMT
jgi:hypothetical protein